MASQKIEQLIRGKVRTSVNLEVANEALSLAGRQLDQYNDQNPPQVYPQPVFTAPNGPSRRPRPVRVSSQYDHYHDQDWADLYLDPVSTAPNRSYQRLRPVRVPSPPRSPFISETPSSPRTPLSTGDAGRGMSKAAVDTMPPGASVPPGSSQPSNTRAKRHCRKVPPMPGDVGVDMGHRTAATLDPRTRPGRRNVSMERHQRDDQGQ